MTRIDWSKAENVTRDPARAQRDTQDIGRLAATPTAKKEYAAAQQARSEAAKRSAATRAANKRAQRESDLQREFEIVQQRERETQFFKRQQDRLSAANARRREKQAADDTYAESRRPLAQALRRAIDRKAT